MYSSYGIASFIIELSEDRSVLKDVRKMLNTKLYVAHKRKVTPTNSTLAHWIKITHKSKQKKRTKTQFFIAQLIWIGFAATFHMHIHTRAPPCGNCLMKHWSSVILGSELRLETKPSDWNMIRTLKNYIGHKNFGWCQLNFNVPDRQSVFDLITTKQKKRKKFKHPIEIFSES